MKNKNLLQFNQLKKTHAGASIIAYLIVAVIVTVLIGITAFAFIFSSFKTKIMGEYEALKSLAAIYEEGMKSNREGVTGIIDASGRDYFIMERDGEIVHRNGKNTCDVEGGYGNFFYERTNIRVYMDERVKFVDIEEDGSVEIQYDRIIVDIWEAATGKNIHLFDSDADGFSEDPEAYSEWNERLLSYPIWLSVDLNGGNETLVGKAYFNIDREDAILMILFAVAINVMAILFIIISVIRIIKNVSRQKKIITLYMTDPVTGGHNWSYYILKGEPFIRKGSNKSKSFAAVEILLIKYRNYCMCLSLREGEDLVAKIYSVISAGLTKREIIAHTSSADYALLLEYKDEDELRARIKNLIDRLENIGGTSKFSFHIGISLNPAIKDEKGRYKKRKNASIEDEYNKAYTARATLEGCDDSRIAYYGAKLLEEQKWLDTVTGLQQKAVANEEFKVYYQPKCDPKTGKLKGAEALIRWQSPELGGLVPPGKFIPIFEKNGFITEIDHYMISHVARDQKEWLDQGLECVPVSVNVSRAHFVEKDLAEQIRAMVDNVGTPHNLIEIELTESAFFDDKNAMINTINKLKQYGFAVSMDDFGSGYSSLNSLKDMPLDVLKLDAEFFRGENAGERGKTVVSKAIELGKKLNMKIVAEGVEDKADVQFLADNECDMIQGFVFAHPLKKMDFLERMKTGYVSIE